jgi:hypothetical protein
MLLPLVNSIIGLCYWPGKAKQLYDVGDDVTGPKVGRASLQPL